MITAIYNILQKYLESQPREDPHYIVCTGGKRLPCGI